MMGWPQSCTPTPAHSSAVVSGLTAGSASADVGGAGVVGGMSLPPSWATATPAIRTVAAVLSGASEGALPEAAVSEGTLLSGMALAGMAGGVMGAAAPSSPSGAGSRLRSTSLKDGCSKDGESPETLQRLVAEMAEKPGIHAVHVSDGDSNMRLPRAD